MPPSDRDAELHALIDPLVDAGRTGEAVRELEHLLVFEPGNAAAAERLRRLRGPNPAPRPGGAPAHLAPRPAADEAARVVHICDFPNSGISWLLTVLLKLGVYCTRSESGHWLRPQDGSVHLPPEHFVSRYAPFLPGLDEMIANGGGVPPDPVCTISHAWPSPLYSRTDTVLLYRNLYAILWSYFKRRVETGSAGQLSLRDYSLNEIETWPGLGFADAWAAFNLAWLALYRGERLLVCSFDYMKDNPLPEIRSLLDFIGVARSDDEIVAAAEASAADRVARADPEAARSLQIRTGSTSEFAKVFFEQDTDLLAGAPAAVMAALEGRAPLDPWTMDLGALLKDCAARFGHPCEPAFRLAADAQDLAAVCRLAREAATRDPFARLVLLAVRFALNLLDNQFRPEPDALITPDFACALKVFLYVFANAVQPDIIRHRAALEAINPDDPFATLSLLLRLAAQAG